MFNVTLAAVSLALVKLVVPETVMLVDVPSRRTSPPIVTLETVPPPAARTTFPVPEKFHVPPDSVPPFIVTDAVMVLVPVVVNVPPLNCSARELSTAVTVRDAPIVMVEPAVLIMAVSAAAGNTSPTQFAARLKSVPVPAGPPSQTMFASIWRSSSFSIPNPAAVPDRRAVLADFDDKRDDKRPNEFESVNCVITLPVAT